MGWLASERGVNGGGISGILSSLQPDWKGEAGKGQRLRLGEIRSRTWCRQPLAPAQAGAGPRHGHGGRPEAPTVRRLDPNPGEVTLALQNTPRFSVPWSTGLLPGWFLGSSFP
ncbi:small cell adhesion glycoprotein isoform X1 [Accipiter gentilis]|uniref:small cell adhesion glycoprotein isoform X1 n=1 Tax=Astur gentilis TaxID=8957 RepID=UPI00210F423E|nr:small cell adhesion glycoprotein isoform X1 [Accipiter gentilis]